MLRALPALAVALLTAAAPAHAAELRGERVGTFDEPVYVTSPPGHPRTLAVVERYGRVRLVRRGRVLRRPLLDLRRRVLIEDDRETIDQRGLLSIAFAPDYRRSGRLYVDYVDTAGRLRVDEWRRGSGRLRRVLDLGEATTQHHGGQLQFGPDGLLYVSTGMGDDPDTSQDPASPGGKILRLDPRERPARPEVVALGLRNPWRFSFDRPSGLLLIGGYVLRGRYLYGDVCSGRLWSARLEDDGTLSRPRRAGLTVPYLVSFGRDARGRVYAVSLDGPVWRIVPTA
jgi:glucose/arabinose dehydrogenase